MFDWSDLDTKEGRSYGSAVHISDPDFSVLHAIRLRGIADEAALRATVALDGRSPADVVAPLVEAGLVKERTGRVSGWTLTREGRERHVALLEADRSAGALVDAVRPAYQLFMEVNQPFIDLCTAWQVRSDTGMMNDHADPAYDADVLDRLQKIHGVARDVASQIAAVGQRFGSYGPRFEEAIGRVRTGDLEWFTKPMIDSYHTIWFELHEDLLLSQGMERAEGR